MWFSFLSEHGACGSTQRWTDGFLCFEFLVVVQLLTRVQLFAIPWTAARQASLSFTLSRSLLKLISIESVMPSNHLVLCCPFFLLPSIFPSIKGFFQWVGSSYQVAKVLELQLQHQSFSEYSGLISFRIDWFDLLAVQGTFKQHSCKASVLWCSNGIPL